MVLVAEGLGGLPSKLDTGLEIGSKGRVIVCLPRLSRYMTRETCLAQRPVNVSGRQLPRPLVVPTGYAEKWCFRAFIRSVVLVVSRTLWLFPGLIRAVEFPANIWSFSTTGSWWVRRPGCE